MLWHREHNSQLLWTQANSSSIQANPQGLTPFSPLRKKLNRNFKELWKVTPPPCPSQSPSSSPVNLRSSPMTLTRRQCLQLLTPKLSLEIKKPSIQPKSKALPPKASRAIPCPPRQSIQQIFLSLWSFKFQLAQSQFIQRYKTKSLPAAQLRKRPKSQSKVLLALLIHQSQQMKSKISLKARSSIMKVWTSLAPNPATMRCLQMSEKQVLANTSCLRAVSAKTTHKSTS